ncbi:hypothetical protein N665_0218s0022 [Sinapis alba]|nr:hypothetical protein N665_0218s0022 [Sinapis alba]
MKRENNHTVQEMWMLLVRTTESSKRREVWFDVPIRYGLREHALISELNCCNYPLDYKACGEPIRLEDVKEKLVKMGPYRDRQKMAVMFFLGTVVCAQRKRAVDDLDFCQNFLWGRYSYYYMLKEISHTMDHFGGVVKGNALWPLPVFCVPLEILAFGVIPKLGKLFSEHVEGADVKCPRMCKSTFEPNGMKGMSLSLINKELGHETISSFYFVLVLFGVMDIHSIIPTKIPHEEYLLDEIMEDEDDVDEHD